MLKSNMMDNRDFMNSSEIDSEREHYYNVKSIKEFKVCLKKFSAQKGIQYKIISGTKSFEAKKVVLPPRLKIRWSGRIPYLAIGSRTYTCCEIHKTLKLAAVKLASSNVKNAEMSLNKPDRGCPATIRVKRIYLMPQYKVCKSSVISKNATYRVQKVLKNVKEIAGKEVYSFYLPNLQECQQHLDKCVEQPPSAGKPVTVTINYDDDDTIAGTDFEVCADDKDHRELKDINDDCPKVPSNEEDFFFANTFEEFKEILQEHEIKTVTKYVFAFGTKNFSEREIVLNSRLKLHWQNCMPYFHFGARTYICHQGKDLNLYQKKKYIKQKQQKAEHKNHALSYKVQTSKKNSCLARVTVVRMYQLPKYEITAKLTKKRKSNVSSLIKGRIACGEPVKGIEKFRFNLPATSVHQNHEPDDMIEPVDDRVRNYISALVYQGHKDSKVVAELLEVFVTTQLKPNNMIRRRFYPDTSTIKRIMSRTRNCIGDFDIHNDDIEILIIS